MINLQKLKESKRIIIASPGRSGSTMLYSDTIKSFYLYVSLFTFVRPTNKLIWILYLRFIDFFLKHLAGFIRDPTHLSIAEFKRVIFKSHCLPSQKLVDNYKIVYVVGDPLEYLLSCYYKTLDNDIESGMPWFELHKRNVHSTGSLQNIFTEDVLKYKEQLTAWIRYKTHPNVFVINYPELWDKVDELSRFLGFPIYLAERKPRRKKEIPADFKFDKYFIEDLRNCYRDILAHPAQEKESQSGTERDGRQHRQDGTETV